MEEITLNAEKPIEIYIIQNHSYCIVYHAIQMSSGLTNNGAVLIANFGLEKKKRNICCTYLLQRK